MNHIRPATSKPLSLLIDLFISLKNRALKSEFNRNVLILTSGTAIAQAIPVLISPVLTRIYSPSDFGALALFISITSIVSVISCGRYELAIMLPEKDEDAIHVAAVAFIFNLFISAIFMIFLLLFGPWFLKVIKAESLGGWIYLAPFTVFFMGIYNILNYTNNRMKLYKDMSRATVYKSIAGSVVQVALGFLKAGVTGLISGQIISQITANLKLFKNVKQTGLLKHFDKEKIKQMAKRYVKFPKYDMGSGLLNISSNQIPVLLLSYFFNPAIVGFYMLSQRVITIPMTLVGSSIGQVFYQQTSEQINNLEKIKTITETTFKKLVIISVIPFSLIFCFGDFIFKYIFGEEWILAGKYARFLSPWMFFVFITSPMTNLLMTLGKLKAGFLFNLLIFISRISAIYFSALIFSDAQKTIALYGVVGLVFWFVFCFYILHLAEANFSNLILFTLCVTFPVLFILMALRYYLLTIF